MTLYDRTRKPPSRKLAIIIWGARACRTPHFACVFPCVRLWDPWYACWQRRGPAGPHQYSIPYNTHIFMSFYRQRYRYITWMWQLAFNVRPFHRRGSQDRSQDRSQGRSQGRAHKTGHKAGLTTVHKFSPKYRK